MKDTFCGYVRPDGRVGVRNHVIFLPTVSCANGVAAALARQVPGSVPLLYANGCGRGGGDLDLHTRTLQNLCRNPNVAAVLLVSLGCEYLDAQRVLEAARLTGKPAELLVIQQEGGSQKTLQRGTGILNVFMQHVKGLARAESPFEHLVVGLECGGSDAFSGITANPVTGHFSDWLVSRGGTCILSETPEMVGTGAILQRRAASPEVARQVGRVVCGAEERTRRVLGKRANFGITPGNMAGGISTIQEKSLGCIVKGGTSPIRQVVPYAEVPVEKGLVIMDGPGYDTDSLSGLAACGAQLIVFTTGRGNPIGFPFVPVVKVATTSQLFHHMQDDMDVNAGTVLEGESISSVGDELRRTVLRVADGEPSCAEKNEQGGILCLFCEDPSL